MPKFKFPFQDLETIPKLIKDFLQQEIPQFSAYQFTLENALLQAEKKAHNYTLEQRKILVFALIRKYFYRNYRSSVEFVFWTSIFCLQNFANHKNG